MIQLPLKEFEVLRLLAHGLSDKQIAHEMKIAIDTVKSHTRSLRSKLKCNNRVKLALTYHNIEWRF